MVFLLLFVCCFGEGHSGFGFVLTFARFRIGFLGFGERSIEVGVRDWGA